MNKKERVKEGSYAISPHGLIITTVWTRRRNSALHNKKCGWEYLKDEC